MLGCEKRTVCQINPYPYGLRLCTVIRYRIIQQALKKQCLLWYESSSRASSS